MTIKLDAGTLIASLPAMLDYQVHNSIVAVMLKRAGAMEAVDRVLRADLEYTAEQIATMARPNCQSPRTGNSSRTPPIETAPIDQFSNRRAEPVICSVSESPGATV